MQADMTPPSQSRAPYSLVDGDRVWVDQGSMPGVRGFNVEPFFGTVLKVYPDGITLQVQREGIGFRGRKVPVVACRKVKSIDSRTPIQSPRISFHQLGVKQQQRLTETAEARVMNEMRRLELECEKLRTANSKAQNVAASEKARCLKRLEREKSMKSLSIGGQVPNWRYFLLEWGEL